MNITRETLEKATLQEKCRIMIGILNGLLTYKEEITNGN